MAAEDGVHLVHRRSAMRASADPRAARTRALLFEAAQQLCADDRAVSVSALTRQAGVSRAVFYTHFADLGELVIRMQEPHFAAIAAQELVEHDEDHSAAMLHAHHRLVAHVQQHRPLYRAALRLEGGRVAGQLVEALRGPIESHIGAVGGAPGDLRADVVARYVAGAVAQLVSDWVLDRIELDHAQLARHLHALMPAWMHERPHHPPADRPSGHREGSMP